LTSKLIGQGFGNVRYKRVVVDVRIGHIERRFTEDLAWAKDKPEILKAKPAAFAAAAWNLIMPCGGKPWIDQDKPEAEPAQKKKARG
jgi:hypothetical protein